MDLPPLRERKEDIPTLAKHFISRLNRLRGKSVTGIGHEALALLISHDYPGNIRELENIIEHAFVLCPEGRIEPDCLPNIFKDEILQPSTHSTMDAALQSVEAQVIMDVLRRNQYNRLKTARDLGIHKSTLFRKIKMLGIDLPKIDGRAHRKKAD